MVGIIFAGIAVCLAAAACLFILGIVAAALELFWTIFTSIFH